MQHISVNGKQVAFHLSGTESASPVVLLHGFCADSSLWQDWTPLVPSHQFVCIDLPGFGQSGLHEGLSIESMADSVIAVADHLGISKFHLAGHSMGGYVSLALAEKHPQRLSSLCMFHSHAFADPEDTKAGRLKYIRFIKEHGHILYVRQMIPNLFNYDYARGYPMDVNKLIYHATHYAPEAIVAALEAMRARPDRSEVLKNAACPVLFIIGSHDPAIPLVMSYAQAYLPNVADIQLFSAIGHMGMFEDSRGTAKAYRNFLSRFKGW